MTKRVTKRTLWILATVRHINSDLVKHHCILEPWYTWKYSATSQTPVYMGHKKGQTKARGERAPLVKLETAS